jgi:DNA-binding response OmpR family regulator
VEPANDVLVVEDDPDMAEIMRYVLRREGYEVRVAENGQRGLEAAAERLPGLILLDMLMPVMDGWQCARELRAKYGRRLPIVVVSAAEHMRSRCAGLDVDDVLPKPFELKELLRLVARYAVREAI